MICIKPLYPLSALTLPSGSRCDCAAQASHHPPSHRRLIRQRLWRSTAHEPQRQLLRMIWALSRIPCR